MVSAFISGIIKSFTDASANTIKSGLNAIGLKTSDPPGPKGP
jgi:hypothetical protein